MLGPDHSANLLGTHPEASKYADRLVHCIHSDADAAADARNAITRFPSSPDLPHHTSTDTDDYVLHPNAALALISNLNNGESDDKL